jgi:hypothetical protein
MTILHLTSLMAPSGSSGSDARTPITRPSSPYTAPSIGRCSMYLHPNQTSTHQRLTTRRPLERRKAADGRGNVTMTDQASKTYVPP